MENGILRSIEATLAIVSSHAVAATALALLVALAARFVRHVAIVHALWVVVLLKFLLPPLYELDVIPAPAPPPPAAQNTGIVLDAEPASRAELAAFPSSAPVKVSPVGAPAVANGFPWAFGLLTMLAAGSLAVLILAAVRWRSFRQRLSSAGPADRALVDRVGRLAPRFGVSPPRLRVVPARISPMLWPRWSGAELLMPDRLVDQLSDAELDAVVAHELAHLERRDHWVRGLELVTTVLFWWHPVLWWARRELRRTEERCCDARVAQALPGQARAYAEALLKTLEFLTGASNPLPAAGTGIDTRHDMKERFTMILTQRTPRRLTRWHRWLVAAAAVALLVVVPSRADREGDGDSDGKDGKAERAEALAAEEARYREQALELERRQLELEVRSRELEAQRRELEHEREMLHRKAESAHLEERARELEASGQALEAELHHQQQLAVEREMELVRRGHEVERRMLEEMRPMEEELQKEMLRLEELELQGRREEAMALRQELEGAKQRLGELHHEHQRSRSEIERAHLEQRLDFLAGQRQALLDAGQAEKAEEVERKMADLRAEAELGERHYKLRSEHLAMELAMREAAEKLRRLEASGDEEAARKLELELEKRLLAREEAERAAVYELEQAHQARRAAEIRVQELRARIEVLERSRDTATAAERDAYDKELAALKQELDAVYKSSENR